MPLVYVPTILKSGSFNLPQPSGPVQACNVIALALPKNIMVRIAFNWLRIWSSEGTYVVMDIPAQWSVGDSLMIELLPVSHSGLSHEFC
jgi:hypothetical protein